MLRRRREIHALRGVSFTLHEGESVGIVGRNGSGKSTLLNALTGLQPLRSGLIRVQKRPTLLGVGAALQGTLSGRRNIELGGLALGLTVDEVRAQTESIIEFAELRDFIDLPLSSYSSGMRARLAFSIATASIPDILLVDEALAVGDAAFSRRSAQRIDEIRRNAGTVALVSHNMEEVAASCDRVIWIDSGLIRADGPTEDVIAAYQQNVVEDETRRETERGRSANLTATAAPAEVLPDRESVAKVRGPRRFILHIGVSMAGTQGVQQTLADARADLRDAGYWYPTVAGKVNQYPLVAYASRQACGLVGIEPEDWEDWRATFADRFVAAAPTQGNAVASTQHAASYLDEEGVGELCQLLERAGFEALTPVLIVRRQDERAAQRLIERLRSGDLTDLPIERFFDEPGYDLSVVHDVWAGAEMVDEVELRQFPDSLDAPTAADHVFDLLDVKIPLTERSLLLDQLPGVDLHTFDYVRRLGREMRRSGALDLRAVRVALTVLARRSSDELPMTEAEASSLMRHFADANRRIAERMDAAAAAYLERPPRAPESVRESDLEYAAALFAFVVPQMR